MYYIDRSELDRISKAGLVWHENEFGNPVVRANANFWIECEKGEEAFTEPMLKTGNWEAWVATAISKEIVRDNCTFIDVGANVGYYTLMCASSHVPVMCFEPDPAIYEILCRSISLNKLDSFVIPYNFGLSDKNEKVKFYVAKNHSGGSTFVDMSDSDDFSEEKELSVMTLDYIYEEYQSWSIGAFSNLVIKVDVEGYEKKVWYGAELVRSVPNNVWYIEWVPERDSREANDAFLSDVLKTHDLQVVNTDGTLRPVGKDESLDMNFETLVLRKRL